MRRIAVHGDGKGKRFVTTKSTRRPRPLLRIRAIASLLRGLSQSKTFDGIVSREGVKCTCGDEQKGPGSGAEVVQASEFALQEQPAMGVCV